MFQITHVKGLGQHPVGHVAVVGGEVKVEPKAQTDLFIQQGATHILQVLQHPLIFLSRIYDNVIHTHQGATHFLKVHTPLHSSTTCTPAPPTHILQVPQPPFIFLSSIYDNTPALCVFEQASQMAGRLAR